MKFIFTYVFLLFVWAVQGQTNKEDYYKYGVSASDLPVYMIDSLTIIDANTSFGISDPDLDSASAVKQATCRAQAVFNLSNFAKVQTLTSFYQNESYSGEGGSFQSYSRISNLDTCIAKYTVIDTFFTRFNEAIVRLDFNIKDSVCLALNVVNYDSVVDMFIKDSINCKKIEIEKFVMEYVWGEDAEPESQIDIRELYLDTVLSKQTIDIFEYVGNLEVNNVVNEQEVYFPELRYNYKNIDGSEQFFKYGLWIHFIKKLQESLVEESKLRSENVQKLDENYKDNVSINRGLAANVLSFNIRNVCLKNSVVSININFTK